MKPEHIWRAAILAAVLIAVPLRSSTQANSQPPTPESAESHLGKGYDALKQDRYPIAVEEFRAALALDPSLVLRAQFPLAVALFEMHRSAEARRELEAVHREAGDHPNVLYYLGRLDIEDRKFDSAIKNLSQAIAKPPLPDTAYYLGFAYFKQGDLTNAEKWLKEAEKVTPEDARVPYQLGFVLRKLGREEEARQAFAQSDALHHQEDTEAQLRTQCGQKLDEAPREEARAFCDKLYHPDDAERLTSLGAIYGQHGDLEAALKPFLRAAQISPQSPQVQYNLALTYAQLGRYGDARGPLEKALKRWPDLFSLNALYGVVLAKLGEDVLAYNTLRHAQQLNPEDTSTTDLLFETSMKLGEKNHRSGPAMTALRYFGEAAKLHPQAPEPHRGMAEIYSREGKPAEAAAEQKEADRLAGK